MPDFGTPENYLTENKRAMTSFRLAIELTSQDITNGLGYFVTFSIPTDALPVDAEFEKTDEFKAWAADVKSAVQRAHDQPFSHDNYTRKVALTELMFELSTLNDRHIFQIGFKGGISAVEIHSSNPHDPRLLIDFVDRDGNFTVEHKAAALQKSGRIHENGHSFVTDVDNCSFPFKTVVESVPAQPTIKAAFIPHAPRF